LGAASDYGDSAFYRVTINYFDARSTKTNFPRGGPGEAARVQRQMAEGGIRNLGKPPHGENDEYLFPKTEIADRFKILSIRTAAPP
jgi:hypothetical protein